MKKFKCTVVKTTEMEIEIDDSIWTPEYIAEWQKQFYDADDITDVVTHIATMKSECENGAFIEGFGIPMINGNIPYNAITPNPINICNETNHYETDVEEIK